MTAFFEPVVSMAHEQRVYLGDNLKLLPLLPDESIDAAVTDPPYGLAFLGKSWDKTLPDRRTWSELLRTMKPGAHAAIFGAPRLYHRLAVDVEDSGFEIRDCLMWVFGSGMPKSRNTLKPAYEPILICRKPGASGAINVEACRIETTDNTSGRWPANLILDDLAGAVLDAQSGTLRSGAVKAGTRRAGQGFSGGWGGNVMPEIKTSEGGASRFFYCAKVAKSERVIGENTHPTVKPVDLMRWLVRLLTPPGGLVLDPFCGSGSTGVACAAEGVDFLGMELDPGYTRTAEARIAHARESLSA